MVMSANNLKSRGPKLPNAPHNEAEDSRDDPAVGLTDEERVLSQRVALAFSAGIVVAVYLLWDVLAETFVWHSSPLDWCEENYQVTEHVVEFWNSMSSFVLCSTAVMGPYYYSKGFRVHEPNMYLVWTIMMIVGLGSVLFHGTLSIAGQVLDELPISLLNIYGMIMMRPLHKWNPRVRDIIFDWPFFLVIAMSSFVVSLLFPILSHVTCVTCMPMCVYFTLKEYRDCKQKEKLKPLFIATFGFFGLAFGCWVADRLACTPLVEFFTQRFSVLGYVFNGRYIELHAWWHIFVAACFWCLVALGVGIRTSGDGHSFKIAYIDRFKLFPVSKLEIV